MPPTKMNMTVCAQMEFPPPPSERFLWYKKAGVPEKHEASQTVALSITSYVVLGKLLNLSKPHHA